MPNFADKKYKTPDAKDILEDEVIANHFKKSLFSTIMFDENTEPFDHAQIAFLLHKLIEEVAPLNRKFDLAFSGHALIKGKIIDIAAMMKEKS